MTIRPGRQRSTAPATDPAQQRSIPWTDGPVGEHDQLPQPVTSITARALALAALGVLVTGAAATALLHALTGACR